MVKITNGKEIYTVSKGAFDTIYKRRGFKEVVENEEDVKPVGELKKTEDELFLEEVTEKPLSSWSKEELKRFTDLKGIDTEGAKSVNEVKDLVKAFIEKEV